MSNRPQYFDLQINGYVGVDFHRDDLSLDEVHKACAALRRDGVESILYTVITEKIDHMERTLRRIVELREQDSLIREVIAGIHIEGPFISAVDGYRGAHPRDAVIPATVGVMQRLLDAAGGLTKIVTLAPENDEGMKTTNFLAKQGIRVSAGHTNASLDELSAAIDAGLSMFTHLGNGCPMMMHRHDNIIHRALSLSESLWLMFIADGAHVAFPALRNYLRAASLDRCIVVTDAVAPAGQGPGQYTMGRWNLLVEADLVVRAPDRSHLIGSALSMSHAVERLIEHVGLTPHQAMQLTSTNPRIAMGMNVASEAVV